MVDEENHPCQKKYCQNCWRNGKRDKKTTMKSPLWKDSHRGNLMVYGAGFSPGRLRAGELGTWSQQDFCLSPRKKTSQKGLGGANKEKRSTGSDPQDEGLSACFSATNKVHYWSIQSQGLWQHQPMEWWAHFKQTPYVAKTSRSVLGSNFE